MTETAPTAHRRLGAKYFKGRVIRGERTVQYIVWDGVKRYRNVPPLDRIAEVEKMEGEQLRLQVDDTAVEDIYELIAAPLDWPEVGGLVVWAKDHRTYLLILQRLSRPDRIWMQ
jgi:hypothetical protein